MPSDAWVNGGSPPPSSAIPGFTAYTLGFYLLSGPADMATGWSWLSSSQRQSVKSDYANAGIKLLVAAFGSTEEPATSGADPVVAANGIADFVTQYGLDGVDVDFEDFTAFTRGTAEGWLIQYTRQLRLRLPSAQGYISEFPSFPCDEILNGGLMRGEGSYACSGRAVFQTGYGGLSRWRIYVY